MSQIIFAVLMSVVLAVLTGLRVFEPGTPAYNPLDIGIFVVALVFGFLHVRTVIRSVRDRSKSLDLSLNLENANIKLTQLDKLKSEFLSFASHQIKAPMTVVKGYAQLINDGSYGAVSDQVKDITEKIKVSSDRMIGLVDTFLNLRRIDEGIIQYHMEPIDVGNLAASIVDDLQQLAVKKHLTLTLQSPARIWRISADTQHLRQVIQNLVDNSIKYTEVGSVTVSISEGDKSGTVKVQVSDTGRGISRELAPKLFEQFSRDPSISKEIAGTGLGLYIAKRIVEAHGGRIWATSPGPGKGSSFIVELPSL